MQTNKPKVVAFANQKGGVGKTTTTLNLAAAFSERGYKVLILELFGKNIDIWGINLH